MKEVGTKTERQMKSKKGEHVGLYAKKERGAGAFINFQLNPYSA